MLTCGEAYRLHYEQGLRGITVGSALPFGSAIDGAISNLLKRQDPVEAFDAMWKTQELNGKHVDLSDTTLVEFSKSDVDLDWLTKEDIAELEKAAPSGIDIDECVKRYKQKDFLYITEDLQSYYNKIAWYCLRRKGYAMIEAFRRDFLPMIDEVIAIQKPVKLVDGDGDEVVGYIDLVVKMGGKTVVVDLKTASSDYDNDSVKTSQQLGLYAYALKSEMPVDACAYMVLNKRAIKTESKECTVCGHTFNSRHSTCPNEISGKRCGGEVDTVKTCNINTQFLMDTIPEKTQLDIVSNFNVAKEMIKHKLYIKNFNKCLDDGYGRRCIYYDVCHNGDSSKVVCPSKKEG